MNNVNMGNVPVLSVDRVVRKLSDAYVTLISNGSDLSDMPSVMLWGPPGVGKSQAVRQIAERISLDTGKRVEVTDVRLLLFNPIDLRGIPTANEDKTLAVWLKPKIFQMDDSEDVINILFLDEISAAPQSVQAAAYQITLDRTVGEHKLPQNCIVIAAGNRVTDRSVAYKMPKALANRLMHIEVPGEFEAWRAWAVKNGINSQIVGFLSFRNNYLMQFDASSNDLAFATPRSWEMVSNILNNIDSDVDSVFDLISGIIGTGTAIELRSWAKVYKDLPSVEDIFLGKAPPLPKNTDALYALVSSMTAYAREHKDDLDKIANSISYAMKMTPDFSVVLMQDYIHLSDDYLPKLMGIPAFSKWMHSKGSLLNGNL